MGYAVWFCESRSCLPAFMEAGFVPSSSPWKQRLLALFMILACSVAILQCFVGSDVLKWRSYYATKDDAWKAHYREVFDHGIREVLCCLGRVKYL